MCLHLQILPIDLDPADSKHVESVYEKKKPFRCEICVYSCFIKQNMDRNQFMRNRNDSNATFVATAIS